MLDGYIHKQWSTPVGPPQPMYLMSVVGEVASAWDPNTSSEPYVGDHVLVVNRSQYTMAQYCSPVAFARVRERVRHVREGLCWWFP